MAEPGLEPPVRWQPRADVFELATARGKRRLHFRPDIFRAREVGLAVDRKRVAVLPYPKPEHPYHELSFDVDGVRLDAAVWLPEESWAVGLPLAFDVFAEGRSIATGRTLEEVRSAAPRPGNPPPRSFAVIETVLRVAPAAAAPGLALAMTRRAESWGWPATIGIIAVMILAVALATQLGGWAWRRIRARGDWSVARRALTGSGAIAASFVGMLVAAFAVTAAVGGSISPGTAVALPRDPCAAEKLVLDRSGPPGASTTWTTTLADLVLADPGVPATRDFDGPLSLNGAARTRADPDARAKLEAAGFAEAYQRTWDTPDGRVLFAEIFAFRDSAGAMQFHRQTIEYSCRFSNMAFEAPFPASVGQQLRYAGAESIVDQVHWVDGRYRIIVFHSFAAPPEDHTAVIDLAKRADHRLRSAE